MIRQRIEHCMFCGKVLTIKREDENEYLEYHLHFYYKINFDDRSMFYTGIICLDHVMEINDKNIKLMTKETRKILPDAKPVNKNFGVSALKEVDMKAYFKVRSYISYWGEFIPSIVEVELKHEGPNDLVKSNSCLDDKTSLGKLFE